MSQLNEKIRILLQNRKWTQAELAKQIHVAPSTVQKWVTGKNNPTTDTVKELCALFGVSYEDMLNDDHEIIEYITLCEVSPLNCFPGYKDDSTHIVIDAALERGALLHRFRNAADAECSAIYIGTVEHWWTYRADEARLIREWNERFI